jgi:hypothetical protein
MVHIIGEQPQEIKIINPTEEAKVAEVLEEVSPEQVVEMMKVKALCCDVLFYLTCIDHKANEVKPPRNRTNYSQADYERIFKVVSDILQLQDTATRKLFEKNISTYLEGLLGRLKSGIEVEEDNSEEL